MPVDWSSSSSSDEELRTALRRNATQMRSEGRALANYRTPTTFYNGEAVEVKYGTIYCPFRKRHFHILPVKKNPAAFFGDANVRRRRRRCISPSSIQLLDATSSFEEANSELKKLTLNEIRDTGFYIFHDIKEFPSPALVVSHPPLLQDFRYSRLAMESSFKERLVSPVCLSNETGGWRRSGYQIAPTGTVASFLDGRFAFFGAGQHSELCVVENEILLPHSLRIPDGSGDVVGMHAVGPNAMVIVRKNRIQHLFWDSDASLSSASWTSSPESYAKFSISCTNAFSDDQSKTRVFLASGRSLFTAVLRETTFSRPRKLCVFHKAPVSSIATFSVGPLANQVVLCGTRNGTIQMQSLQAAWARSSYASGITPRAASIPYINCVEGTFNFVTASINGEVKLWDLRYMHTKEPVSEMEVNTAGGRFHDIQAAFVDDIACFTDSTGCINCINTRKWLSLGQYQRVGGSEGRLYVVRNTAGYQILDAGFDTTMTYLLHIVYSCDRGFFPRHVFVPVLY
ncbi:uncharacterized protein Tco025E_06526 [Trypanosoma conorhini]|uniref:Uncharacterized protein n=1 Tax=Trypanosoma conorhini TaxID=83891 RepID=A0A3R7KYQ2_9TRYP|nr:uncharacterized protein Tco025E_06526 [Trypanosoma conorhini]RNF12322.1 hypothetical protein Tco025E_06526 [Trypanosoma conorhini]